MIVVRLNYRLGVLGYVRGKSGLPANLGLLDVIAALLWIRENIESFGGNSLYGHEFMMGQSEWEVRLSGKPMRQIWSDFAKTGTVSILEIPGMMQKHLYIWTQKNRCPNSMYGHLTYSFYFQ